MVASLWVGSDNRILKGYKWLLASTLARAQQKKRQSRPLIEYDPSLTSVWVWTAVDWTRIAVIWDGFLQAKGSASCVLWVWSLH